MTASAFPPQRDLAVGMECYWELNGRQLVFSDPPWELLAATPSGFGAAGDDAPRQLLSFHGADGGIGECAHDDAQDALMSWIDELCLKVGPAEPHLIRVSVERAKPDSGSIITTVTHSAGPLGPDTDV